MSKSNINKIQLLLKFRFEEIFLMENVVFFSQQFFINFFLQGVVIRSNILLISGVSNINPIDPTKFGHNVPVLPRAAQAIQSNTGAFSFLLLTFLFFISYHCKLCSFEREQNFPQNGAHTFTMLCE